MQQELFAITQLVVTTAAVNQVLLVMELLVQVRLRNNQWMMACSNNTKTNPLPIFFNLYDVFVCIDIDECLEDNGGCAERCNNTEGGYFCDCYIDGYEVIQNSEPCQGEYIHNGIFTYKYTCFLCTY